MLDACGVSKPAQEIIFGGTVLRLLDAQK